MSGIITISALGTIFGFIGLAITLLALLISRIFRKSGNKPKKVLRFFVIMTIACFTVGVISTMTRNHNTNNTNSAIESKQDSSAMTIEPTIILDNEDFTIIAEKLEYDRGFKAYRLDLKIENKSNKEIYFSVLRSNVNGYSIDSLAYTTIFGGGKGTLPVYMMKSDLQDANIEQISFINFTIGISDNKTEEKICDVDANIKTSLFELYKEEKAFDGTTIFDNGTYCVKARLNEAKSAKEPVIIFVENNSNNLLSVRCDDVMINGQMISGSVFQANVLPNTCSIKVLTMMDIGQADSYKSISSVENVSIKVSFIPWKSGSGFSTIDMFESDVITITD